MSNSNVIAAVYEIKVNRKWSKVRATSMKALSDWSKQNNVADWRMVGMMSKSELEASKTIEIVA
jgi:hypothetical protein